LFLECDESWSFVDNKENKLLLWLAMNRKTIEIVAVHVGARSKQGARGLWNSLPQNNYSHAQRDMGGVIARHR